MKKLKKTQIVLLKHSKTILYPLLPKTLKFIVLKHLIATPRVIVNIHHSTIQNYEEKDERIIRKAYGMENVRLFSYFLGFFVRMLLKFTLVSLKKRFEYV